MQFRHYQMLSDSWVRSFKRELNIPKKTNITLFDILSESYEIAVSSLNSLEGIVIRDEQELLSQNYPIIFIEDLSLIDLLRNSTFQITEASFRTPFSQFVLAFPMESKIPGLLVSYNNHAERQRMVTEFCNRCDLHESQLVKSHDKTLAVTYSKEGGMHYRQSLPVERIASALHGLAAYEEQVPEYSSEIQHVMSLSRDEQIYQYEILRLVSSICVYMAAFPEQLIPGLPHQVVLNPKRLGGRPTTYRVKPRPEQLTKEGLSYRNSHFRELAHPRFHRDENGNIRVVQVKSALVGRRATPHILTKKG